MEFDLKRIESLRQVILRLKKEISRLTALVFFYKLNIRLHTSSENFAQALKRNKNTSNTIIIKFV